MFTMLLLSIAVMNFANDINKIVVLPIKKIVDLIQRLAEGPLKKPEAPKPSLDDDNMQMKTKMLELTIYKIGNLL